MAQLRFQPRPTLWHPRLKPELVVELPLQLPNAAWYALPHILVRRIWFWCVLSNLLFTFILFQQDGFVVPSTIIVTLVWLAIIVCGILQYPAMRADFEKFRIGIEIHDAFLRIPYLMERDMPWENVRNFVDLAFRTNSRDASVVFLLRETSYLRASLINMFWCRGDALYVYMPFGHNWRYVATALTTAAQQFGNAVESAEEFFGAAPKDAN